MDIICHTCAKKTNNNIRDIHGWYFCSPECSVLKCFSCNSIIGKWHIQHGQYLYCSDECRQVIECQCCKWDCQECFDRYNN